MRNSSFWLMTRNVSCYLASDENVNCLEFSRDLSSSRDLSLSLSFSFRPPHLSLTLTESASKPRSSFLRKLELKKVSETSLRNEFATTFLDAVKNVKDAVISILRNIFAPMNGSRLKSKLVFLRGYQKTLK